MVLFSPLLYGSISVNILAFSITGYLFKQAFKNYQSGTPMSHQRKLRIATVCSTFCLQIANLLSRGQQLLDPSLFEQRDAHNCTPMLRLNLFTDHLVSVTVSTSLCFIGLTTLNRYERMNLITSTHASYTKMGRIKVSLFLFVFIIWCSDMISTVAFCSESLRSVNDLFHDISTCFQGIFAIIIIIGEATANIKMIAGVLTKNIRNAKSGYKRQLYGYFWILLLVSSTNIVMAVVTDFISFGNIELQILAVFIIISIGLPFHIFFSFLILDLFIIAIRKPAPPTRGRTSLESLPSRYAEMPLDANGMADASRAAESDY